VMPKVIRTTFLVIFLMVILSAAVQRIDAGAVYYAESGNPLLNGNGWSMFQHDPAHRGYVNSEGPHTPNVIWRHQVSLGTHLIATGGRIFFGSDCWIYCLDENTGNILWSQEVNGSIYAIAEYNGKIFLGTFNTSLSNDGLIYCLNVTNGNLVWSYNPSESEGDKVYGIIPVDGKIYVNVYIASESNAQIICLNETTAAMLWNYSLDGEYPVSLPTIEDGRAFVISYRLEMINETFGVNHSHLHCVNATTGKLLWKLTLNLGYLICEYPISAAYENIFVPLSDTKVGCVSVYDGRIIWERDISQQNSDISAFAVAHGEIFVVSYRSLEVINATNGELVWSINGTKEEIEFGWAVPLIAKNRLYLTSSYPQGIWCFDAATGQKLWNYLTSTRIIGTSGSGAIVEGKLFIPLYDGDDIYLFCFKDDGEGVAVWPYVTKRRCDVESVQTICFQAIWTENGSAIDGGTIFVNGTAYVTNSSGWISFNKAFSNVTAVSWVVTAVDCNGVGRYFQMAPTASLIWDRIIILEGGVTPQSADVGEWVTVWFKAVYEYDNENFYGTLLVNDSETRYSSTNERWELSYIATTPGTFTFEVTSIQDEKYGLKTVKNVAGAQHITVRAPFPWLIVSATLILGLSLAIAGYYLKKKRRH
ncbi:PQQ-binding-like beta-propeller repeat protein, partial [Candidatus Bathyarchaeota archaeon]|nr:PQQ-binding-like beta-propeller repeat protein [Candidatus Bathyarchaeota archaeon]